MTTRSKRGYLPLLAAIVSLAWPTMLEQLMQTAVQYIDTAMVGSLGTAATAAVGATGTVNWLIGSTISALSIGFLAFIAKSLGAGDEAAAKRASGQAVLAVFIAGTFFTVLTLSLSHMVPIWMQVDPAIQSLAAEYFFILYLPMLPRAATTIFGTVLRAAGDTKTPMKIGVFVNLLNVILNFFLIYETRTVSVFSLPLTVPGAGLGVIGAAIASAIAFAAGGIAITAVIWRHPRISPRGQSILPDGSILRPCLRVSLPNMLQRFGTSLGYVAFASMINSLGEIATAAHTVANTVESAFYIPGYGMQTAAATLSGNAYGAKDADRMKKISHLLIPLEIGLMILSGGLLFWLAPPLVSLFSGSAAVISLGCTVLRMVALSEPIFGFSIVVEGMMQGVGKTKAPFIYNIIGMWGIRILGTAICTQLWSGGLVAAWACMILHNLFLFLMYLICFVRGTWNPLKQDLPEVKGGNLIC
jgi:putative MATE family efflux protein